MTTDLTPQKNHSLIRRVIVAMVLAGVVLVGYWYLRDAFRLENLLSQESAFIQWKADHPWLVVVVGIVFYAVVAGLSIPIGTVLTLTFGWYFGFWQGLFVASFGSTSGATMSFLISRYLFRDVVQQKMAARLATVNEAFDREGPFYLFSLRLIFAVPFFVINAVMGLTRIKTWTFWWVSQLGMLPATAAYVYAGSTLPSLQIIVDEGVGSVLSWKLIVAFLVLGLLPLAIKRVVQILYDQSA